MVPWPPSPMVEDEATALEKEHGLGEVAGTLKVDDQPVPSRGDVDQRPVIVDSDDGTDTPVQTASSPSREQTNPEQAEQPCVSPAFRNDTGLPTPPPSDNETRRRSQISEARKDKVPEIRPARSKSTTRVEESRPSRPALSRMQTDLAGEIGRMKDGTRRAPSPYSYTRERGTFRVDPARYFTHNLTPFHATPPSGSINNTLGSPGKPGYNEGSADSGQRSTRPTRVAPEHQEPVTKPLNGVLRNPLFEPGETKSATHRTISQASMPDENRKFCRQVFDDQAANNSTSKLQRSKSKRSRASSRTRESPYSSSAEESVRNDRYRSAPTRGSEDQAVPLSSSPKRERPRLEDFAGHLVAPKKSTASDDDAIRRVYRIKDGRGPMTPPAVSTPQRMEDYFGRAFQENASMPSRYAHRPLGDETAMISPPTSPPQTPRNERPPRFEYLESPSSPRPASTHSRGPSFDEGNFRELKSHTLLSQATSIAAALASKTGSPTSRSTSNTIETTLACTTNVPYPKVRSRASSPQRERAHCADTFTYGDQATPKITYPPVPQSSRPSTRDGLPKIETSPRNMPPPPRNASWTSYEPRQNGAHLASPLSSMTSLANAVPGDQRGVNPPLQRSQSANAPQAFRRPLGVFEVPPCPRSNPSQGLRDWTTFKGLPQVDFCPSCALALQNTPYGPILVRNLDKPSNKSTVCSLSKPWIRVAIIQAVKHRYSDLAFLKNVAVLPDDTRPCAGARPDIRRWWRLKDPAIDRIVPDFFACNACIWSIHHIFPDLPHQFEKSDGLLLEQSCSLRQDSKRFGKMVGLLDEIHDRGRSRGKSLARDMQPFVDHVRRVTRYPECARDTLLINRAWHFMSDLPEFTICDACYEEVVWPLRDKRVARDISTVGKIVPPATTRSPGVGLATSGGSFITQPISCQLYSDRMRRIFIDVVSGRICFELFSSKVRERQAAQHRLTEMNKMYEEDQKMGWDRRTEIEKNKQYWKALE